MCWNCHYFSKSSHDDDEGFCNLYKEPTHALDGCDVAEATWKLKMIEEVENDSNRI